ncbi:hypothetical protein VTK26DRAFT_5938 [Humicola hyalothermophila]
MGQGWPAKQSSLTCWQSEPQQRLKRRRPWTCSPSAEEGLACLSPTGPRPQGARQVSNVWDVRDEIDLRSSRSRSKLKFALRGSSEVWPVLPHLELPSAPRTSSKFLSSAAEPNVEGTPALHVRLIRLPSPLITLINQRTIPSRRIALNTLVLLPCRAAAAGSLAKRSLPFPCWASRPDPGFVWSPLPASNGSGVLLPPHLSHLADSLA